MHVSGKHRSDRVKGVVSVEPLGHEALERAANRKLVSQRDLTLDYRMNDRVHRLVREANARSPVILLCQLDALLLIHCDPFFWIGGFVGIVTLHVKLALLIIDIRDTAPDVGYVTAPRRYYIGPSLFAAPRDAVRKAGCTWPGKGK